MKFIYLILNLDYVHCYTNLKVELHISDVVVYKFYKYAI